MARQMYGATPADFATTRSGQVLPLSQVEIWDHPNSGNRITDLLDYAGNPSTVAVADSTGGIRFWAPDGENRTLWFASGEGERLAVRPVNLPPVTNDGVGAEHLRDGSVVNAKIANDAVDAAKIAAGAVGADELGAGAVTDQKIAANAGIARSKIAGLPTVSVDNRIIRADGTGGALQTSPVSIDDTGRISGLAAGTANGDAVRFQEFAALGVWAPYSPTLAASTTNPTGWTVAGRYTQLGKLVIAQFTAVAGGSMTAGNGTYRLSLPVPAAAGQNLIPNLGNCYDSSTGARVIPIAAMPAGVTDHVTLRYPETNTAGTSRSVSNTLPWAWGSGDEISATFIYEAA